MGIGSVAGGSARRAVFLDRDGVLNRAIVREGRPYPPPTVAEMEIIPGAAEALRKLQAHGYLLLVVTNQPDVARGTQERSEVEAMHRLMAASLPLDDFLVCYHDDQEQCACRKPKPGLLEKGAARYGVDLSRSYMVGDRWRDVDAGRAAGCRTVFLDCHYAERSATLPPDAVVQSLDEAVEWIIGQELAAAELKCRESLGEDTCR